MKLKKTMCTDLKCSSFLLFLCCFHNINRYKCISIDKNVLRSSSIITLQYNSLSTLKVKKWKSYNPKTCPIVRFKSTSFLPVQSIHFTNNLLQQCFKSISIASAVDLYSLNAFNLLSC